ncbi:MAG: NAD-dependent epimerase/dehydratase family protein, partial [Thermoplasmatota archaeon]
MGTAGPCGRGCRAPLVSTRRLSLNPHQLESRSRKARGMGLQVDSQKQKEIRMKNVLVTGGLGFIGSNVVLQLLKKDISVIVADLENKKNKEKL